MKMKLTTACLMAAVVLVGTNFAQADTYWQNAGTGNWSNGSNWDIGEPHSGVSALINNGGTAQITAPNDECCHWLYLGYDSGDRGKGVR